ncbi:OmpL47-type beta-barrel domain-containing protein [Propionibacteriaceae bacterium G57]|uniref:OmpL47-type beta-barrel domain-containing protein n=1 Tax=Aestuariimicrobium sp. G57 TaxID=3418485 RepID=UPI003DA733BD
MSPLTRRTFVAAGAAAPLLSAMPALAPTAFAATLPQPGDPATPAPGGMIEALGAPIVERNIRSASSGVLPDGRPVLYVPSFGEPAVMSVVDARDGSLISGHELTGKTTAIYTGVAPDQSYAYIVGTTPGAALFRYETATGAFTNLGNPVPGESNINRIASFGPDGTLYTGTFPNGHVATYHPDRGFEDWGPIAEGEQYARCMAVVGDKLFVGTGTNARFFEVDLATRAKREIALPPEYAGNQSYVNEMYERGGLVFAFFSPAYAWGIYDPATGQWRTSLTDMAALVPAEVIDGQVYLVGRDGNLYGYEVATGALTQRTTTGRLTSTLARGLGQADLGDPAWPGTSVIGIGLTGSMWHWNPVTGQFRTLSSQALGGALKIAAMGFSPGRQLYVSGFLTPGRAARIDPDTLAKSQMTGPQQAEFIGSVTSRSGTHLYLGTYIDAAIWQLDETKAWQWGTNPRRVVRLDDRRQERVLVVANASTNVAIGTLADKGDPNGALTIVNPDTGAVVHSLTPVPEHSVSALLFRRVGPKAVMIGGTSSVQLGVEPTDRSAKLFVLDLLAGTTHAVTTPSAVAENINQLVELPDGRVWALVSDSSIHEVTATHSYDTANPFTLTTRKVVDLFGEPRSAGSWGAPKLQVLDADTLLGNAAGQVFTVTISTGQVRIITEGSYATADPVGDGRFFFADLTKVYRYTPERVAPATTASFSGDAKVVVTLDAKDDRAGVARTEYRVDGGEWQAYAAPFGVRRAPRVLVEYRSVDQAGNVEQVRAVTVVAGPPLQVTLAPSQTPTIIGGA